MSQSLILPRTITIEEFSATINIKFKVWWRGYYISVSETAKALKAIAKSAGFNVLGCKSQSYSWWNSCDIYIESELSAEQLAKNSQIWKEFGSMAHPEYTYQPRADLINMICKSFQGGTFDGMTDSYDYRNDTLKVEAPNGEMLSIDTKYCFSHFVNAEEYNKWHK